MRIRFAFTLSFFAALLSLGAAAESKTAVRPNIAVKRADRPNILLILIDDMSWSGPGCYGNKLVDTPNIDRLASRGMTFTSAYVTPSCSPTRTELLSGEIFRPYAYHQGPAGASPGTSVGEA